MAITITDSENVKQLKDGAIELTDANGKVFRVDMGLICDASADAPDGDASSIKDDNRSNVMQNFELTIEDSEGEVMDEVALKKAIKDGFVSALDVTFEATHTGLNKNSSIYTSDSMYEDSKSWMFPFRKPLIKNHNMYEEPIGRVRDAVFGESEFDSNKDTIDVTFRVSNTDSMEKFADRRYQTMSIGATAGAIKCNTCGKDILKDEVFKFCGHWRGDSYAGKKATWTTEKLEYKEGSIVNNPADVLAQVKRIKVIKVDGGKKMNTGNKDNALNNTLDLLDATLGTNPEATPAAAIVEPTVVVSDNDTTPAAVVTDGEPTPAVKTVEDELKEAKENLDAANEKIETLEAAVAAAKDSLATKEAEFEGVNTKLGAAEEALTATKDQVTSMALLNRQLLLDSVKALEIELSDEEVASKSARDLYNMIKDFEKPVVAKPTPKNRPRVINPGLGVNDNNSIQDDDLQSKSKPKLDANAMLADMFSSKY